MVVEEVVMLVVYGNGGLWCWESNGVDGGAMK